MPISLTAFSGRAIEAYRLESLRDVSRLTPGLLVSSFNQSSPTIAIRGATNTFTQIGANKPVAVVIDDLFIPRNSAATFELYGLNSVQVLKGPQGTLFGRNVTGGAIVLDTGKPAFGDTAGSRADRRRRLRPQAGRRPRRHPGRPRTSALRLAGSLKQHDGYGKRPPDRPASRTTSTAAASGPRPACAPATTLEVLLGADYADDHNGGRTLSSKAAGSDGDRRTSELGYVQGFAAQPVGALGDGSIGPRPVGQVTAITGYRWSQSGEDYSGTGSSYRFLTGTNSQSDQPRRRRRGPVLAGGPLGQPQVGPRRRWWPASIWPTRTPSASCAPGPWPPSPAAPPPTS